MRSTKGLLYALAYVFMITLLLFPGTCADTEFKFILNLNLLSAENWY